jgi:hypothetical protein
MKRALTTFAIVFAIAVAGSAYAQTPNIQIYFDENFTEAGANCPDTPPGTVIDTFFVVANNFNMWMSAIEFMIVYPSQISWLGDILDTPTKIGNSVTGISIAWTLPLNAFDNPVVLKVTFAWMCQGCVGSENAPIDVVANPNQGFLRAVRWPDNVPFDAIGMRSLICPTVPVEDTSWGQIKAMYN